MLLTRVKLVSVLWLFLVVPALHCNHIDNEIKKCNLPSVLIQEIRSYTPIINRIIKEATQGSFKGYVYNELATFVDKFGNRFTGSLNLENAIDYMIKKLNNSNLDNVHSEEVKVPRWIRNNESATLLHPRLQNLPMLGLGDSVGIPDPSGITAEAVVVHSFEELDAIKSKVREKIVVFNEDWINYGETVKYRDYAAAKVASYGGIATLVRSVTPFSLNTPHTGWQDYSDDVNITKIPTACITVEDAHMLSRMYKRGDTLIVNIKMQAEHLPSVISRNTIAEIRGSHQPERVVLLSGHLDTWDVGQGAMDDGGGAFISWAALALLKKLNLGPARRTLRSILWTGEEVGLVGAFAYAKRHKNETMNFDLLMESDEGTFNPLGIEYAGVDDGGCILQEILQLFSALNATQLVRSKTVGSDIMVWANNGIPSVSLLNENKQYFWYHHSNADTMDIEDSDILDKCVAVWSGVAYIVADLSVNMPKK